MQPDDCNCPDPCGFLIIGVFEHLTSVNECVFTAASIKQGSSKEFCLRHEGIKSLSKGYRERFWQNYKGNLNF